MSACIDAVALTAEMVINAFSMAREEFYDMVGKVANKPMPFIKIVNGGTAVGRETSRVDEVGGALSGSA